MTPLCSLIRSSIASMRPIDHLHVDGVDALRQDLAVLGQLPGNVGAGLIDHPGDVAESLLDGSRHGLIAVVHSLRRARRRSR